MTKMMHAERHERERQERKEMAIAIVALLAMFAAYAIAGTMEYHDLTRIDPQCVTVVLSWRHVHLLVGNAMRCC